MSATKRFLEELSEKMGFGGEITDEVMYEAEKNFNTPGAVAKLAKMKKVKWERAHRSYQIGGYNICVELTDEEWKALDSMDYLGEVQTPLENAGATKIEYNGHFGRNVFFTVASTTDARAVTDRLMGLIQKKLLDKID